MEQGELRDETGRGHSEDDTPVAAGRYSPAVVANTPANTPAHEGGGGAKTYVMATGTAVSRQASLTNSNIFNADIIIKKVGPTHSNLRAVLLQHP